jgi:hypothetical protein
MTSWCKSLAAAALVSVLPGCASDRQQQQRERTYATGDQSQSSPQHESNEPMETLFEEARVSMGADYLSAERKLRGAGAAAVPTLRAKLQHPDYIARSIAKCLLNWIEGRGAEFQAALDYLDFIPRRLAKTPVGSPPPVGVAAELTDRYAARVTEFLAVRLVKSPGWPSWQSEGVLLYLREHKVASTTAPLIRFAVETQREPWRAIAIEVVKAANDPELASKIVAERQLAERQKKDFPKALSDLLPP